MNKPKIKNFRWKYLFVLLPAVVYLLSLTQYWICSNDSALYIHQARSFLQTGTFMHNGVPHLVASPGFPMLLAGIMGVAGESNFLAMQLCMLLCGLLGLAIIYRQRWIWTTRFQARWVVFATAMSYYFYHNIQRTLTEAPSFLLFWIIIALLRAAKTNKWYLLLGCITTYVAVFVRMPSILPIAAIGVAALFERRLISEKFWVRFWGVGILAIAVIAGWCGVWLIANAYQQATPYSPSPSQIINISDAWFTVVDNIGRLFANLVLAQRNWAVGWSIFVVMTLGAWRCCCHRNRKLVFPIVFIVAYAAMLILSYGSWTMMARYWFYALPFFIYYLFKSFELLGGFLTKVLRLPRPMLPLPKFAACMIGVLLLVQFPLIASDSFVSMYGWKHSQQEFYGKFNGGRDAEIMSLADELAKEKSRQWIAASDRASILMAFTGRYVHSLRTKPLDVIHSEQWKQHPPEIILVKCPKPKDTSMMRVYNQLMEVFGADGENWKLDKQTRRWVVFRRKTGPAKSSNESTSSMVQ